MSIENMYNLKSPGVKRLMREARELAEPTEEYYASPLEDNLFEWHFTVRGPEGTEFEGGFYHGRILLPTQYPMQPPNIILLTPNGRFEVNKKICLSISGHHPESWQPSWSIRTALLALIAFMPTRAVGTIGSLDYPKEDRQRLARKSADWECEICGRISTKLLTASLSGRKQLTSEETDLIQQIALKSEEETTSQKEDNTDIRLRASSSNTFNGEYQPFPVDSLINSSTRRSNEDRMWFTVIWTIVFLIALLLMRRLFFL